MPYSDQLSLIKELKQKKKKQKNEKKQLRMKPCFMVFDKVFFASNFFYF